MTPQHLVLGLAIIFAWGFNFVVIRWGLDGMTPMMLGGVRFLVVAAVGCIFFSRPNAPIRWWIIYALPLSFGQFAFLFTAMQFGMPAGLASLVLQAQAIFTILFAILFLKEYIRPYQIVAILIAAIGLAVIGSESGDTNMTLIGFALTIVAASSWALGNIVTKVISHKGYNANVNLVIWSCWIPPIPFFVCSFFLDGPTVMWENIIHIDLATVGALIYLSLFATVGGYGLWSFLMTRYSASTVAPLTLGVPIVGLTSSSILLGESISTMQWFGISVVLSGLLLNTFGKTWLEMLTKRFS